MSASGRDQRTLDAFRDYEAAVRLEAWCSTDLPLRVPYKAAEAAQSVARQVLADRLAQLIGVLCIAATAGGAKGRDRDKGEIEQP